MIIKNIAYKIVYKDMMQQNLYNGNYDKKHADINFVLGIYSIMEKIAYEANMENDFYQNWRKN